MWNTGATTPTINVNTAGTYSIRVSDNSCTAYDTIVVGNAPTPTPVLPDSAAICDGNAISLDAANNGASYQWNDGSTNQTLEVSTAGLYTVNITNAYNCAILDSTFVTINTAPEVDLGNDTIICIGAALLLNAQNNGAQYQWSTGAQSQSITVSQAGTYIVTVTNGLLCTTSDTIEVSAFDAATTNGFDFTPRFEIEPGRVDFEPVDPMFVTGYHWDFGDGNTSSSQNPSNVYANSGNYLVTLTVTNECGSKDTSLLINVDLYLGVANVINNNLNIKVYPVPAHESITIESADPVVNIKSLTIFNTIGQEVNSLKNINKLNTNMDISNIPSGDYFIRIETNKGSQTRKINIIH